MTLQQPEREQTDVSLRSERERTDCELEKKRAAIQEDSDAVVARAHGRADEVLKAARAKADQSGPGSTPAMRMERTEADRALAEERTEEAAQLTNEREARRRALAELLRFERDETDKDLLTERTGADAALLTRDDFLGMVSHDLKSLLGAIAVSTAFLINEAASDEQGRRVVKRAEGIQRFSARMNRLVSDLLDVVSIDAGRLAVNATPGVVSRVMGDAVEAFHLPASMQQTSLSLVESPGLPLALFDHERILQVLANLLGNAVKFTGPDGRVELRAQREGQHVRVSVADNGPGIPSDQLEAIFERFRQVGRGDHRGHGLGLHISKCIIEAHGGRIWAESSPGQGCTFHFTLPCAQEA